MGLAERHHFSASQWVTAFGCPGCVPITGWYNVPPTSKTTFFCAGPLQFLHRASIQEPMQIIAWVVDGRHRLVIEVLEGHGVFRLRMTQELCKALPCARVMESLR